jgi:serine/threonine-protein kinase
MAGDLDTVVLKALRKNPLDRYASASAFAEDITNYLKSRPVSARSDGKWYRVARFAVRHKAPVTAASFAVLALLGGAALAAWQARTAAAERDRAVALASRNQAVSEFLGRVITEAAESQKPITVSEMLARSEKLALTDKSSSAENRAAVLEMIAQRYQSLDELDRAAELFAKAAQIVADSPDQALRSRLICDHAETVAAPENSEAQAQAISREIERLDAEPDTAGRCLLALSRISLMDHHAEAGIRQASLGLARMREAGQGSGAIAAALLDELAFGYHLTGRNVDADKYFAQSLRQYADLGQERSDGALVVINDWGVATLNAGVPRRAQQLFERSLRIEEEREPGVEPGTTTVGNEALALLALGRFDQARVRFERECRLAHQRKDDYSEAHCWLGFAALSTQMRSFEETPQYLARAMQLMGGAPPDSPSMMQHAFLQGSVDLANGRLDAARIQFERAMARTSPSPRYLNAQLGMAEVQLAAGNAAAALQLARSSLQTAATLQGGLPYSLRTGLAWLTLGRAAQRAGDEAQARKAFESAVIHLSNTVDADHPALLEARRYPQY